MRVPGRGVVAALCRWWTLENVSRAAELAVRSVGALAALAALGFFSLKPLVTVEGPLPIGSIDLELLATHYSPDPVPAAVVRAAKRYNTNPLRFFEFQEFLSTDSSSLVFGDAQSFLFGKDRTTGQVEESALQVLEQVYGSPIYAPPYAVDLALSADLSPADLRFALEAMDRARVDSLLVLVRNEGNGPADDVRLIVPPGFRRVQPFDLAPGEARRIPVMVRSQRLDVRDAAQAFSVDYQPTGFLDPRSLLKVLWVVAALLVVTLIQDVRRVVGEVRGDERFADARRGG